MAISQESFFLDPSFEGTLQKQLQGFVAEAILAGRFSPGEKLPSSRKLAAHLGISRITVSLAYTELVANDYLTSRGRSGYFVSDSAPQSPKFDLPATPRQDSVNWRRVVGNRFASAQSLHKPQDWRRYRYPFIYGQADEALFDHHNWRLCALQALGKRDFSAVSIDRFEHDDPKLVEFIARHTLPRRGIVCRPEEILVTMGAQNALWLAAQLLLNQRRMAVVESPGYPGLREIIAQCRCSAQAAPVDCDGLDPDGIPAEADVVFTTPSHHCPTSVTMPLERRRSLLDRASADDFIVVEDDYEFEISSSRIPSPALKSLDREGRVVYVGSFSKSIFPGLRLGYVIASEPFIREARALRATMFRHPPGLVQRTAAYFLSLGHYETMIRRMDEAYRMRRDVMAEALLRHGLEVASPGTAGGSSFWMRAPDHVDTEELARRLQANSVLIEPGAAFFAEDAAPRNFYRLAYSSISSDKIPQGVALIAAAIAEFA